MSKLFLTASLSVLVGIGLMLTGCSNQQPSQPASPEVPQGQPAATGHEHGEAGGAEHSGHAAAPSEYEEGLSQLSAADRALAEKQKVCPVSGEALGSMGKPYKVTVQGREVFLCCPSCEDAIKAEPEKYLAKLPE